MSIELIKTAHIASSVGAESVDSDAYVDGSIDTEHIADDAVTYAKIQNVSATNRILGRDSSGAGVVEEITPANVVTMLGIEASATADQTSGEILTLLEDGIDSVHYKDNSVDAVHLFDLARGSLLIGNGSAATAELTVGSDNYVLTVDSNGDIGWEAAAAGGISTTLTDGNILVGNGSNVATSVNPSGDVDIATDGTFSIASGAVVDADVNSSAAIAYSKLAALSSGNIIVGNGSNVAASVNPSGDVDVTNAGVFSIASGVIVDADVNASAAIAISKTALVAGTNITLSTNTLAVDDAFLKNDASDTTTGTITAAGLTLSETGHVNISTPLLPSADHTYSGITAQMLCGDSSNIAAYDLVCIHSTTGEVVRANASALATARAIGMAMEAISDTATGTILLQGFVKDETYNWTTIGAPLYLNDTVGQITATAPSDDGDFVQVVGISLTADIAYINPSMDIIEHA